MKVLVVDDEEIIREMLVDLLSEHTVVQAQNGSEAQAVFSALGPGIQAVITDFDFKVQGGMNGLGLIAWLKQHYPGVPVLLMSSYGNLEHHQADEYLQKPVDIREFMETFKRLISRLHQPAAHTD